MLPHPTLHNRSCSDNRIAAVLVGSLYSVVPSPLSPNSFYTSSGRLNTCLIERASSAILQVSSFTRALFTPHLVGSPPLGKFYFHIRGEEQEPGPGFLFGSRLSGIYLR